MKEVITELKHCCKDPANILFRMENFFGEQLSEQDSTVKMLLVQPSNKNFFCEMKKACISTIVIALKSQYKLYFEINISEQLRRETVMEVTGLGRLQDQGNRLRLRLLENTMITITFILDVIDYDYIVK